MSGKLKIIRVLGNPRKKTKAKPRRAVKKKTIRRQRARKIGAAPQYVLRIIDSGRRALWYDGKRWQASQKKAKKFSRAAADATLRSAKKPAGWMVADAFPG